MRCFLAGLLSLIFVPALAAGSDWSGTWDTRWRDGGARLELHQNGDKVEGAYASLNGTVEGTVSGNVLKGRWHQGTLSGGFDFVGAADGQAFVGRYDTGEWWTGARVTSDPNAVDHVDLSTPRAAMRTFLRGGNSARYDAPDELVKSAAAVDFGSADPTPLEKLNKTRTFFDLVDATTFRLFKIPDSSTENTASTTLQQAGTDAEITVDFRKTGDDWRLVMPDDKTLAALGKSLYARFGGHAPGPDDYKLRRSASDAYRTFTHAFYDWRSGGSRLALSAIDLSAIPEAIRTYQGDLSAQYLARILNRVGLMEPQEIPDDPNSNQPYILFSHPAGQVAIAPVGTDKPTTWAFTKETVRNARELFEVMEDLPPSVGRALPLPPSPFFSLRGWVQTIAPSLLTNLGPLEIWQAIGWVVVLAVSIGIGLVATEIVMRLALGIFGSQDAVADRRTFRFAVLGAISFAIYKVLIPVIGIADELKQFSVGATGILLIASLMWLGWITVDALGNRLFGTRVGRNVSMDNIVISLLFGLMKLALLVVGLTFIAIELSLPYEGIIASLSIGGLAVAFASRETLSNVFGAGVLAIDRPFRRGDSISAGGVDGTVEHVGIRSTRIRTGDDSLIIVPNGKLSDTNVSNLGSRRFQTGSLKLPLPYDTSVAQLEALMKGAREIADAAPMLISTRTSVSLVANGTDGLQFAIGYNVDPSRGGNQGAMTNQLLLDILKLCEKLGIHSPDKMPLAAE